VKTVKIYRKMAIQAIQGHSRSSILGSVDRQHNVNYVGLIS